MKWVTDTSYNIKISWKYNGKQTKEEEYKPTIVGFPIPPTKVHKDKKEKSRAKERIITYKNW